jgi:tight adherence protein B
VIPLVLALGGALGVYLAFEGLTNPEPLDPRPALARQRERLVRGIREFLAGAGLPDVAPSQFALASGVAGLVCAVLAQLTLGWPIVAVVAFGLGLALPFSYFARRRDRRRAQIQEELADAIDQLTATVRAGLAMSEALAGLAVHGPVRLRPEWEALVRDQQLIGLGPALAAMRERLADPTGDLVFLALAFAEQNGGRNVTSVLAKLSQTTRARVRLQAAVRAEQARHRLTAQVLALMPLALLLVVRSINPDYLAVYDTLLGQAIIGVAVALVGLGYVLMLLLARLPEEPRVFR